VYSSISVIWTFIRTLAKRRLYMTSDRWYIFNARTKIMDSESEATFESFRILENKQQRRKSTSLHCGFIHSVKTTLSIRRNGKDFLVILWLFTYPSWVFHVSFYVSNNASTSTHLEVELQLFIMLVVRTYFRLYLKYNGTLKFYWNTSLFLAFINLKR